MHTQRKYFNTHPLAGVMLAALLPAVVQAGPTGEQIIAGQVDVSRPSATHTQINQGSDKAIINWQDFSVGGNESVNAAQPSSQAILLNRVVGGNISDIQGQISSNGQMIIVNPRGVMFGQNAQVDVNALTASTHDIADQNFLNGQYTFEKNADSPAGASVVNNGTIRAQAGGYVVLGADKVENNGLIEAQLGTAVLASGNKMTMTVNNGSLVDFAVDEAAVTQLTGVNNSGQIIANGGHVLMTAKVAEGLVATAVNNTGLVQAQGIQEKDGVIILTASGANVANSGTLDASASGSTNQHGGTVYVYSDKDVEVAPSAQFKADGAGSGNGGTVRVIAERDLVHPEGAVISAKAGAAGTKGGFVEVSGHRTLQLRGSIELGTGGKLLIDPNTLTILAGADPLAPLFGGIVGVVNSTVYQGFIEQQLNAGVNVQLIADGLINSNGPMTITATNGGSLDILIGSVGLGSSLGGLGCIAGVAAVCQPGGIFQFNDGLNGDVMLGNVNFNLINSALYIKAGTDNGSVQVGNVNTTSSVNLIAGNLTGDISAGNISAGPGINIYSGNGAVNTGFLGSTTFTIEVRGGSINIGGGATATASNIALYAKNSVSNGGALSAVSQVVVINNGNGILTANLTANSGNVQFNNAMTGGKTNVTLNTTPRAAATNIDFVPGSGSYGNVDLRINQTHQIINPLTADTIAIDSTGALNLANDLTATIGDIKLKATGMVDFGSAYLHALTGNMFIDGMGGVTASGGSMLDAQALKINTGGSINLGGTTTTIGSGSLAGEGDEILIDLMAANGLPTPDSDPNLLLIAPNGISMGSLTFNDSHPYAVFVTNTALNLSAVNSAATNFTAQFTAHDPLAGITVEENAMGGTLPAPAFTNADHFVLFAPAATIVVGSGSGGPADLLQEGDINIGQRGTLNLGAQNFICLTAGLCESLDNVTTSGQKLSLNNVLTDFAVPIGEDFGDLFGDDDDDTLGGEADTGDGEGEVQVTDSAEKELMCS